MTDYYSAMWSDICGGADGGVLTAVWMSCQVSLKNAVSRECELFSTKVDAIRVVFT